MSNSVRLTTHKVGDCIQFGTEEMCINYVNAPISSPNGSQWSSGVYVTDTETASISAKYNPNEPLHYIGVVNVVTQEYLLFEDIEEFIEWETQNSPFFVFHNAAFDVPVLRIRGAKIANYYDTIVGAAIWEGGGAENFSLDKLASKLGSAKKLDLRKALIERGTLDPKAEKGQEYKFKTPEMSSYLVFDLHSTLSVYANQLEQYATDQLAFNYLVSIEIPYIERIIEMEQGVLVDDVRLGEIQGVFKRDVRDAHKALQELLSSSGLFIHIDGETYLPAPSKANTEKETGKCEYKKYSTNSSTHNLYILQKLYGYEPTEFTDKGTPRLDKNILETLDYPFVEMIMEIRSLEKLLNTFVDGIKSASDPVTKVLYPSYCQICTRTHRLSSRNPNLQNLPARTESSSKIRELFKPPEDYVFAVLDLDRIEAVLLGWWLLQNDTPDDRLAKVFWEGIDLHQTNADSWGISRFLAKTAIYLLMYGGGAQRLSIAAKITLEQAMEVFNNIDEGMPAIKILKDLVVSEADKNLGILHDPLGNRYTIPELLTRKTRFKGERLAFSYVNQGFAGSIFKELQIRFSSRVSHLRCKQVFQVHDEVVFVVHKDDYEEFKSIGDTTFSTYDLLTTEGYPAILISGEFGKGYTWLEAK